jgi:hypothetical protein
LHSTPRRQIRLVFGTLGLMALGACTSNTDPVICTADLRAGLVVTVLDSASGQAIASSSLVVARQGTFADTARVSSAATYGLLYERAGVYDVTVSHAGYRDWHRSGVTVPADRCHVQTVALTARLQP